MERNFNFFNIQSSANWSRQDTVGYDPFGLRLIKFTPIPFLKNIKLVSKHYNIGSTLNTEHVKKLDLFTTAGNVNNLIPNLIHFIWLGSVNVAGTDNIETWINHNPDKSIILWTDQLSYLDKTEDYSFGQKKLLEWCKEKNIILLSVKDILSGNIDNEIFFMRELSKPNYGAASDIVRLEILKLYGGIYSDIDIACIKPPGNISAERGIKINCAHRNITNKMHSLFTDHIDTILNDLIISTPNHPEIIKASELIKENFKLTFSELFKENFHHPTWSFKIDYEENFSDYPTKELFRFSTIELTGPRIFVRLFGISHTKIKDKALIIDVDNFEFHSGQTWMEPQNTTLPKQASKNRVFKIIFTNILADLKQEARILRLDAYTKIIKDNNLCLEILMLLVEKYPELSNKIEYIYFNGILNENNHEKSLKFIFNKQNFSKLKHNSMLYFKKHLEEPFCILWLLNNLENISNLKNEDRENLLHLFSQNIKERDLYNKYLSLSLKRGLQINQTNAYGQTPLRIACSNNNYNVVITLVNAGANVLTAVSPDYESDTNGKILAYLLANEPEVVKKFSFMNLRIIIEYWVDELDKIKFLFDAAPEKIDNELLCLVLRRLLNSGKKNDFPIEFAELIYFRIDKKIRTSKIRNDLEPLLVKAIRNDNVIAVKLFLRETSPDIIVSKFERITAVELAKELAEANKISYEIYNTLLEHKENSEYAPVRRLTM